MEFNDHSYGQHTSEVINCMCVTIVETAAAAVSGTHELRELMISRKSFKMPSSKLMFSSKF